MPQRMTIRNFPPTLLGFGGDEMMSGDAPDYEAAFKRSGMKDYSIHIEPDTFHACLL